MSALLEIFAVLTSAIAMIWLATTMAMVQIRLALVAVIGVAAALVASVPLLGFLLVPTAVYTLLVYAGEIGEVDSLWIAVVSTLLINLTL